MLSKLIAGTVLVSLLVSLAVVPLQASSKGSESERTQQLGANNGLQSETSLSENSPSSENEWALFQHDPAHSGYTLAEGPHTPNVIWKREFAINPPCSVVSNDKVFLGSQNVVNCLNESSGELLWESKVCEWVFSIAEDEGKIFVGAINSTYLILCCLDEADGRLLWSYNPSEEDGNKVFEATPTPITLNNGKIHAGAYVKDENRGYLLCLNQTSHVLLWNFSLINETIRSSPTVEEDRVFIIGSGLEMINETFSVSHSHLYCVNATIGELIWKLDLDLGDPSITCPVSTDHEKVFAPFSDTKIVCAEASDGEVIWQYEIPDYNSPVSCFAVAHGELFVGSYRRLDVLNETNAAVIWDINGTETGIEFGWTVPLVAKDRLYLSTDHPQGVWCFNATTGERLWNHLTITKVIGTAGSGSIANGKLFIPLFDSNSSYSDRSIFFCFEDQGEGVAVWPFVTDAHCDVNSSQTIQFHVIWTYNGSAIDNGVIFVNGTEYAVGPFGRVSINHSSHDVTAVSWVVTAVNCSGITKYFQMGPIAEIIWDTITILDGGSSPSYASVGEYVTIWFKAAYQYQNESFSGLLFINGSAASYSDANKRWEYQYKTTNPGTVTFTVTGVSDEKYELKTVNDVTGFKQVSVHAAIPWVIIVAACGVGVAILVGCLFKKCKTRLHLAGRLKHKTIKAYVKRALSSIDRRSKLASLSTRMSLLSARALTWVFFC